MNPRSDIHLRLAASLKEARTAKGLSLDAVAKLSGVSRSMVSQIERGESSPTVATLWNLTQALQVDFAGLLEPRATPRIEVIRAEAAPVIAGRGQGVSIRILSPAEAVGVHEVYDLTFSSGGTLASDPHGPGCREHLTILDGKIRVTSGEETQHLGKGDTARYFADRPHRIEAEGGPARAILIVQNS
ncbi:helix-turn-helix domain-containing protein [Pseudotabrizicola algicola]|uniref:Helix-turn-helix domain-containing protein n=1 Tax=Pseudotabrizicola algicola TaxID=2709381 RepID=A0A6B3RV64_9RHOB|nr:helix-turn-helix domain-containing protein [Pseudotabrizicola algicola]NEX46982.1 helix-turn-helix domain-containing protein [Pseudotabrizicola algicola]